jgi:hypothetical protein
MKYRFISMNSFDPTVAGIGAVDSVRYGDIGESSRGIGAYIMLSGVAHGGIRKLTLAVRLPLPPVKRTRENAVRRIPPIHHQLHTAVPARIVVRLARRRVHPRDDHRLVEDVVHRVISRIRYLLQPTPHPRDHSRLRSSA